MLSGVDKIRYRWLYLVVILFGVSGAFLGDPSTILEGLKTIFFTKSLLITDHVGLVGYSAAFVNSALVALFAVILMDLAKMPVSGKVLFVTGLMAGHAFFGKNIYTMWFIVAGTYILAWVKKEPVSKYMVAGVLSSALGPIISCCYLWHGGAYLPDYILALGVGIVIGFMAPLIAEHTATALKGLSLYNVGCTVGFVAIAVVAILSQCGVSFESQGTWYTGRPLHVVIYMYVCAVLFIVAGFINDKKHAWKNYLNILKKHGRAPQDFFLLDGTAAVLVNIGFNLIVCTTYVLLIGGDINGGTLGGIVTIMGFGAHGKHTKNIIPIIMGVFFGGVINPSASPITPAVQMAAFLGTTLAPMSGTYGPVAGIITGMVHSFIIVKIGAVYQGANLYNNGFCGAIAMTFLYPVFRHFFKENTYGEPSENIKQ